MGKRNLWILNKSLTGLLKITLITARLDDCIVDHFPCSQTACFLNVWENYTFLWYVLICNLPSYNKTTTFKSTSDKYHLTISIASHTTIWYATLHDRIHHWEIRFSAAKMPRRKLARETSASRLPFLNCAPLQRDTRASLSLQNAVPLTFLASGSRSSGPLDTNDERLRVQF